MDAIEIEGLTQTGKDDSDPEKTIYKAESTTEFGDLEEKACERCGVIGGISRNGKPPVTYWDSPTRGKRAQLRVAVQRFRCAECGGSFPEDVPGIAKGRLITVRCVEYIRKQCLIDTWVHVAGHIGCDEALVRRIAREYIDELKASFQPELPAWLGIDETKIAKGMRCVLTDVVNRRPVDMLIDREAPTVANWLSQFGQAKHLKGFAMDMWRPYWRIAHDQYPKLPVVVDKFHLVRKANAGLDKVRVRLQRSVSTNMRKSWKRNKHQLQMRPSGLKLDQGFNLDLWLGNEPELAMAYHVKETFFEMYDYDRRSDAETHLDKWVAFVPKNMRPDFSELLSAVRNWREEILAYFDVGGITNGYTECFNGLAKIANRAGRGYTFDVLRARVLWGLKPSAKSRFKRKRDMSLLTGVLAKVEEMQKRPGNGCTNCLGLFPNDQLEITHIKGSKVYLMCPDCRARLHKSPFVWRG